MNQVAGPFASAAFGFHRPSHQQQATQAYHYGGATPQQTHASAPSQAFAPAPQAGYNDGHNGGSGGMASNLKGWNTMPQFAGQHHSYTTAAYSPSVPAQASPGLVPQPQPLQQHNPRHSASPQQPLSPDAASQAQQNQPTHSPSNQYPMAAPPLPQTPGSAQQALSTGSAPSPGTPQSPGSQSRDQQRVALLLDINAELLQEVSRLQSEGKGGASNPQQQALLKAQGQPMDLATDDYVQVLRRIQANLGYLMPKAQNDQQKAPKGPAHMTPPPHMPQLQPRYDQLQEIFPDWQGYDRRPSASSASPQSNGVAAATNGIGVSPGAAPFA
ncbi:hypothetical protein LTR08_001252 [Meristemomyces frigidus]|nr:hypothetical protein LTR08_001252 [Meristemomyces frigidus]